MPETRDSDPRRPGLRRLVLAEISDPDGILTIDAFVKALIGDDAPLPPKTLNGGDAR